MAAWCVHVTRQGEVVHRPSWGRTSKLGWWIDLFQQLRRVTLPRARESGSRWRGPSFALIGRERVRPGVILLAAVVMGAVMAGMLYGLSRSGVVKLGCRGSGAEFECGGAGGWERR